MVWKKINPYTCHNSTVPLTGLSIIPYNINRTYHSIINGIAADEWTLPDVVDMALFEAVRRSINGEIEGYSIVDLLHGEWSEVNLP